MKAPFSYVPLLPAAVGIALGIILINWLPWWAIAGVCAATFAWLYFTERQYASFFLLMTMTGAILAEAHKTPLPDLPFHKEATYGAEIISVIPRDTSSQLLVSIQSIDGCNVAKSLCLVDTYIWTSDFEEGAKIEFRGKLTPLAPPSIVPYAYDYLMKWRNKGVISQVRLTEGNLLSAIPPGRVQHIINDCRDVLYNGIVDSPVSGKCAAFLLGTVLGDKQWIDSDQLNTYRLTGVSHILALSGLHVGILASLLSLLLVPLRMHRKGYVIRAILVMLLIWAYAIIVGMTPSVVRASVMISIFLIAQILQRGYYAANSLCAAFVLILVFSPDSLYDIGFQMSFIAVASILLFNYLLPKSLQRNQRLYYLLMLVLLPIAAMLGTGVVSAFYFHMFPGMFLLANVVVGLFFPLLLSLAIIMILLTMLGAPLHWLGAIVDALYTVMNSGISSLASVKALQIDALYFNGLSVVPYAIGMVLLVFAIKQRSLKCAIWSANAFVIALIAIMLTQKNLSENVLYLPAEGKGNLIIQKDDICYLIPATLKDTGNNLVKQNRRYEGFLSSVGCKDGFIELPRDAQGPIEIENGIFQAGNVRIAMVDDKPEPDICEHVHYAMVCEDFTGKICDLVESVHPDTVFISGFVPSSRARRLIRECADTIPVFLSRDKTVTLKF